MQKFTMFFVTCCRELLGQNSENLCTLLPQTIYNELQLQSTTRNPNNMLLISAMFHQAPEQSTKASINLLPIYSVT